MVIFETERLVVRKWTPQDAKDAFEMYNHPDVVQHLPRSAGDPLTVEDQRAKIQKTNERYAKLNDGTGFWAVEESTSGKVIGTSLLVLLPGHADIEVGWLLHPAHWGKGYASEAAKGALQYGFEKLDLQRIVAVVRPENERSIAVARRLGMKFERVVVVKEKSFNLYTIGKKPARNGKELEATFPK